jgi:hypothetical protein
VQAFLDALLPQMDEPHEDLPTQAPLALPWWQPTTELETQRSLNSAKGPTAPGEGGLLTVVWKQLGCSPRSTSRLFSPRASTYDTTRSDDEPEDCGTEDFENSLPRPHTHAGECANLTLAI